MITVLNGVAATVATNVYPLFAEGDYGNGWSLKSFFQNLIDSSKEYIGYVLILVGIGALAWSVIQAIRKYVFSSQEVRTGPVTMIAGALAGAALMVGGWTFVSTIGNGLNDTVKEFGGNGTMIPMLVEEVKWMLPF